MSRIVLDLPDKFEYSVEMTVHIGEINYGGHVGTTGMMFLIQDARIGFLDKFGYKENDVEGYTAMVVDSVVIYKSEAFHGDILKIEVAVGDFSRYGCALFYKLIHKKTGREVARAKTGLLFFDRSRQRKTEVPKKFKSIFIHEDQLELGDLFQDMESKS